MKRRKERMKNEEIKKEMKERNEERIKRLKKRKERMKNEERKKEMKERNEVRI